MFFEILTLIVVLGSLGICPTQIHTLSPKSLQTFRSVWSKTTLNPGGVGRAGANPQTCKKGTFFLKCKIVNVIL